MEGRNRKDRDAVEITSLADLHAELSKLEKMARNFTIIGDGAINFQGNLEHGFSANLEGGDD
jgi:hypothetical protein